MDILEIIKQDYQRFPENQTYSIYAADVYFKDPLNEFTGIDRYRKMIGFLASFFRDIVLDLHHIQQHDDTIKTEWTLNMTPPLPWKPRISIPGWTELKLNSDRTIASHIDRWHISPLNVVGQVFFGVKKVHNNN
ncbi:MAG: DUF2358 domain-containing protein [Pleurocapsa sp.]